MPGPTIRLTFAGDPADLLGALRQIRGGTDETTTRFQKFSKGATIAATAVVGALGGLAKEAGEAASQQQQALGGAQSVFKDSAGQIEAWANTAADSVGLSKTAFLSLAAPVGASLKGAGFSIDEAAAKTNVLIGKGADLAATFGGSTTDAVDALGSALRGEFDPLERYGIILSANAINAELAAKGQDKLTGSALELAKKQATLDLINRQSADSTGQFGRESNTAAGAAERQAAKLEDLKAKLGTDLLPIMTTFGQVLQNVTSYLSEHSDVVTAVAIGMGGLAIGVYAVKGAVALYQAGVAIATGAQWLWNVALSANPIGLVVLAIGALVAAFVILWNQSEGFRNFFIGAMNGVKNAAVSVGSGIANAFRGAFNWVADAWNNTIGRLSWTVPGWVPFIGGSSISVPRLPKFHNGGVVPGVPGSEMVAVLQAGETVIPASGRAGGGGGTTMRFVGNTDSAFASLFMQLVRSGQIQIQGA